MIIPRDGKNRKHQQTLCCCKEMALEDQTSNAECASKLEFLHYIHNWNKSLTDVAVPKIANETV